MTLGEVGDGGKGSRRFVDGKHGRVRSRKRGTNELCHISRSCLRAIKVGVNA